MTEDWQQRSFWRNRRLNHASVAIVYASAIALICGLALRSEGVAVPAAAWLCTVAVLGSSAAGVQITHARWRQRCAELAARASLGGALMIAPLAQAMSMDEYPRHPEWRSEIASALTAILAHLQPEDSPLIADTTWARLASLLKVRYTAEIEDLQAAILQAAAAVGAWQLLPAVSRLARIQPAAPSEDRVRAAATECRSALTDRLQRERQNRALLRPAPAPGDPSQLLRPAAGTASQADSDLLRPAQRTPP